MEGLQFAVVNIIIRLKVDRPAGKNIECRLTKNAKTGPQPILALRNTKKEEQRHVKAGIAVDTINLVIIVNIWQKI